MPTPTPTRAAKARTKLADSGGRRLEIHLDADAADALAELVTRLGLTAKAVVRLALLRLRG